MVSATFTLPKSQAKIPSARNTWYSVAPETLFQLSETWLLPDVALTFGAAVGVPAQPESCTVGVPQAISWSSKAWKMACMCGVPLFRLPSSSSAAR